MSSFRVIIVGGGLGGLTLANCLQHANVDFILLEGHKELGIHVGAAVGIDPNGGRILDQLGVFASLESVIMPYRRFIFRNSKGKIMFQDDSQELTLTRTGYPNWVYERRYIVQKLYNHIWDKERVHFGKRVEKIEHSQDGVKVFCKDGSDFSGHIVVGQDGVHSAVRKEMWRLADDTAERFSAEEKDFLTIDYRGLYGVSPIPKGMSLQNMTLVVDKGVVCYWATMENNKLAWCLVERMDEQKRPPNGPKYTEKDAIEYAERYLDKPLLTDTAKVKFRDVWEGRQAFRLVALEEGHLDRWTWGRIVCTGDSVHKVTPESGQGANQAIESAAALANHIHAMVQSCGGKAPSLPAIRTCLESFEAKRKIRTKLIVKDTNLHVRLFTQANSVLKFLSEHLTPFLGDSAVGKQSDRLVSAERVDYLPVPARSLNVTMPFNQTIGVGATGRTLQRAMIALPLLVLGIASNWWTVEERSSTTASSNIFQHHYGERVASFLTDLAPIYLVWLLEGNRRGNQLKLLQLALFFGPFIPTSTLNVWANIWFYFHYVQSPVETFAASDQRLLHMNSVRALLPSFLVTYLCLFSGLLISRTDVVYQDWLSAPMVFPILLFAVQRILAKYVCEDTTKSDARNNPKSDLPYLRHAIHLVSIASSLAFWYSWLGKSDGEILPFSKQIDFSALVKQLTNLENLPLYAGAGSWLIYLYSDLKDARMVEKSWLLLLTFLATGAVVIGPGATLVLAWMYREDILATKRHWAAVTKRDAITK